MTVTSTSRVSKSLGPLGPGAAPIVWNTKFLADPFGESSSEFAVADVVLKAEATALPEAVSELPRPMQPETSKAATLPSTTTEPKRPGSSTGRPSSSSLALAHPSCGAHLDPSQWCREPVADPPGWELATCRHCRKFIGWNPIEKARSKLRG